MMSRANLLIFAALVTMLRPSHAQVIELVDSGASSLVAPGPTLTNPVFYYTTVPICLSTLGDEVKPARISRSSPFVFFPRPIFDFNPPRPPGTCNPYRFLSDAVSDEEFVYYIDNQGPDGHAALWRRALFANPSDASQLLVDLGASLTSAQVLLYRQFMFVLLHRPGRPDLIVQYEKATGALINQQVFGSPADTVSEMQVDSRFLYWKVSGRLRRNDLTNGNQVTVLDGPLSGYLLEGYDEICGPPGCQYYDRLLFGQGNVLYEAETLSGSVLPLYTSPDPSARIMGITRDSQRIYFFERRSVGGGFDRDDRLFRLVIGNTVPELIYGPVNNGGPGFDGLTTDLTFLYFRDRNAQKLLRLPNNAAAIPIEDMEATGIEVTQGLQNAANQLRLIQNKRTFVRFYVRSKIAYRDVPGVTAILQASSQRGFLGTLDPINSGGKLITVHYFLDRKRFDYSFQFELPLAWTTDQGLHLTATVNPGARAVEDNLSDNTFNFGPVNFAPSQRLHVGFINFNYPLDGPMHFVADADWAASQRRMRRLYPIGEPDRVFGGPGLHFATANVCDFGLTPWVARNHPDCIKRYKDPNDRNMCASDYVHAQMAWMRVQGVLTEPAIYYGNIPQAPAPPGLSYFTRGYGGGQQGSGPSNDVNYAAHEIGHCLGRPHPSPGARECGHSASDDNYPYFRSYLDSSPNAQTRYAGVDFADTLPGEMIYYDAQSSYDTMAYCSPNWISDYTTNALYDFLVASPLGQIQLGSAQGAPAPVPGDWLILSGTLNPTEQEGGFTLARRAESVMNDTAPVAGGLTLELRDGDGIVLASYGFTAVAIDEQPGRFAFDLVVPFATGTAELRAVDDTTSATLATRAVSASVPQVSDVVLPGAPDPVDGTVTVTWSANDPDGDALRFDLLASRDGGATYQVVLLGIEGTEIALDTTMLGGGTNQLRVLASDGVHTGSADSTPFTVPARAPKIVITAPIHGFRADWNQVVTFEAEVQDVQDMFFDDSQFLWTSNGELGLGRLVQTDQLRVGENIVTVTVTNSLGIASSASITVIVGDRVLPPGPTLSVAPQTIAWHIEDGDTAAQVASLTVENAGGGDLSFDIASGAPWLRIDSMLAVSGATAPREFIISADPTLVPPGTTSHALLTFQSLGDNNDVVTVPVALSRGNVFDHIGEEPTVAACAGDCDASGEVTVDELVRGVNIALERAVVSLCDALDRDADGRVTVNELVAAVNAALGGC